MRRSTLDKIISSTGLVIACALMALSMVLLWGHGFIHTQVEEQLSAQRITFPVAGSEQLNALPANDKELVAKYAGESLTTGAQAKVFADNYIAVHLENVSSGQTYAELSAASMANPSDEALTGKVQTVFRGETLRGLLLNAYAFDTMAIVAQYVAFGSAVTALVLLILAVLGFKHAQTVKRK